MEDNFTQPRPNVSHIPSGIDQLAEKVSKMTSEEYDRHLKLHQHAQTSADDALRNYRKAHGWDGVPLGDKIKAIGGENPQEILQRLKNAQTEDEYQKIREQAVYMNTLREGEYDPEVPYTLPKTEWIALCGLAEKDAWDEYSYLFSEDLFALAPHKKIYTTMKEMRDNGQAVSPVAIFEKLYKEYKMDWVQFLTGYDYRFQLVGIARELTDMTKKRKYDNTMQAGMALLQSGDITAEQLRERLREITEDTVQEDVATLGDALQETLSQIEKNESAQSTGTYTGFLEIDKLGGFQAGDFIVLAGDTSNGKTSFALSITLNTIIEGNKVAYYSLEMPKKRLAARLISMYQGVEVSSSRILRQALTPEEKRRVMGAISVMPQTELLFDDKATIKFDDMLSSIRMMAKRHGVKGVIIDYLQILNVNSKGRDTQEQLMAQVARKLKNVSMECNIWVMALSQLNREKSKPEPTLTRLRDSGQIAEAADVVMLIYRPELYGLSYSAPFATSPTSNTALVDIAKGRDIGTHKFLVAFKPDLTYFYNLPKNNVPLASTDPSRRIDDDGTTLDPSLLPY